MREWPLIAGSKKAQQLTKGFYGGDEEIRTPDPLLAKQVL
jgi:hypothetical protein